ncbi:hypothetical protein CcaverHIS002_0200150 [Cutaneotrichosporon cavernicola]|uniref:Uncharacterized protein n=1 Tax=Cutaneotrichosporon cavernicola TaxID=279322 RepID=A0AA48HZY6_9TREE|nr:uncharacterized protein CcaverHIS019_0200210 [Cutaneotrichosporon cavernicola]BEI80855.1 hypothetical protein CcaverHIS002_0200150 [Cutaneotrichosporon cavernicola]BEI88659.1 hypothetical protein CcaverHIS019_0200210 [Cutaneotrichosporon cavernicola]BEI96432.1 hypothetical protein CcaverHIS631_0200210 [Cutaneotrichosporon cavernicola]BEJ04204.1 hypothetical protein CcaverHIS641_0200210 [Cutaneotrichosporon cavernicola]
MYHTTRSSGSSYDTVTTATSALSRSTSWSGMTAVESLSRGKYPAAPKLAFPTVPEASELSSVSPVPVVSSTFTYSPADKPTRPLRPLPSLEVPAQADRRHPLPEQFRFSNYEQTRQDTWTHTLSTLSKTCSTYPDREKSLLRRVMKNSVTHVRTLSSGSLERIRSLSRRAGCRRTSVYDPKFIVPDTLPTQLEPAWPAWPPSHHRNTSRISRVILQVPPSEPLLPAVLAAADDVTVNDVNLRVAVAKIALMATPSETATYTKLAPLNGEREASRPDSQLLPCIDFSVPPVKCRPSLPPDFRGPLVTCSRRASRPLFTYI